MRHYITPEKLGAENTNIDGLAGKLIAGGLVAALIGLAGAYVVGSAEGARHFWFALLLATVFFTMVSLGGLWFVLIKHLTRSTWSIVVRRIAEIAASNLTLMFVFAILLAIGGGATLFPWMGAEAQTDHLIQHKAAYLNPTAFYIRILIYFGVWTFVARFFHGKSVAQDSNGSAALTKQMWTFSAPAMVLFALTATFFSFDFLMSLTPHWFSTIFGVYYFAGCVTAFVSLLALTCMWLQRNGHLKNAITIEHYHDMGKLMFAFIFFWGYIAFSQFMLIWYGNLPEETAWFDARWHSGWANFFIGLAFVKFALPFCGLMSRWVKKKLALLAFWAVWILAANWYDLMFIIGPSASPEAPPNLLVYLLATLGVGGAWIAMAGLTAKGKSIVPLKDPRLAESLAFENVKV